jgi:hypothetical protein
MPELSLQISPKFFKLSKKASKYEMAIFFTAFFNGNCLNSHYQHWQDMCSNATDNRRQIDKKKNWPIGITAKQFFCVFHKLLYILRNIKSKKKDVLDVTYHRVIITIILRFRKHKKAICFMFGNLIGKLINEITTHDHNRKP